MHPKISIITPNYNLGEYLEETIQSVIEQGYPNLEYIIIDGGSTDNSIEIIKKYEKNITYWESNRDNGMYDAINKGFAKSSGEIMGWINSDDILHRKSLFLIQEAFEQEKVKWIQGTNTLIDETGRIFNIQIPFNTHRFNFLLNQHLNKNMTSLKSFGTIQQESTFWKRSLWNDSGGYMDTEYKLAGDFELWMRFFRRESLYNVSGLIGGFRLRQNQASHNFNSKYVDETKIIIQRELKLLNSSEKRRLVKLRIYNWIKNCSCFKNIYIKNRIEDYYYKPTILPISPKSKETNRGDLQRES